MVGVKDLPFGGGLARQGAQLDPDTAAGNKADGFERDNPRCFHRCVKSARVTG